MSTAEWNQSPIMGEEKKQEDDDFGDLLEVDHDKSPTELYSAICNYEWEQVIVTAATFPEQAKTWVVKKKKSEDIGDEEVTHWRFLPLHSACARHPPDQVIACLLRAYPEATRCRDFGGMLPLHYACGNTASEAVVAMLLMSNPNAARVRDPYDGQLPIHQLCKYGEYLNEGLVHMLLLTYPGSIHERDNDGKTPLDIVLEFREGNEMESIVSCLKKCGIAMDLRIEQPNQGFQSDEGLLEAFESLKKDCAELEEATDDLRRQRSDDKREIERLMREKENLLTERSTLLEQQHCDDDMKKQHMEMKDTIARLQNERAQDRDTIDHVVESRHDTEVMLEKARKECLSREGEITSLQTKIGALELEIKNIKMERSQEDELTDKKIKHFEGVISQLSEKNQAFKSMREELEQKSSNLKMELRDSKDIISRLEDQLESRSEFMSRINELSDTLNEAKEDNMSLKDAIGELTVEKRSLQREVDVAHSRLETMHDAIRELESSNENLLKVMEEQQRRVKNSMADRGELLDKLVREEEKRDQAILDDFAEIGSELERHTTQVGRLTANYSFLEEKKDVTESMPQVQKPDRFINNSEKKHDFFVNKPEKKPDILYMNKPEKKPDLFINCPSPYGTVVDRRVIDPRLLSTERKINDSEDIPLTNIEFEQMTEEIEMQRKKLEKYLAMDD